MNYKTNKIVYNACCGGFDLSASGYELYAKLSSFQIYPENAGRSMKMKIYWTSPPRGGSKLDVCRDYLVARDLDRHDPILVQVVKELGEAANGMCAKLEIYETEYNQYRVKEYDGYEDVVISFDDSWTYTK